MAATEGIQVQTYIHKYVTGLKGTTTVPVNGEAAISASLRMQKSGCGDLTTVFRCGESAGFSVHQGRSPRKFVSMGQPRDERH